MAGGNPVRLGWRSAVLSLGLLFRLFDVTLKDASSRIKAVARIMLEIERYLPTGSVSTGTMPSALPAWREKICDSMAKVDFESRSVSSI